MRIPERKSSPVRKGARTEILAAARAITTRSGRETFTVTEVLDELRRTGSGYPDSTLRTMLTSHLCANAPNHAAVTYPDVERVSRGVYRLLLPTRGDSA